MTDDGRAVRAVEDVVAVESLAPGMVRVVSWSDSYVVDARGEGCACPDKEYNDAPRCKHEHAALLATSDKYPSPYVTSTVADTPRVMADGGECEACAALPEGVPCADCYITGRKSWSGTDSTAADTDTEA
jgi:hypothetical protein